MKSEEAFLVVGPAWVGDMMMAHALLRELKTRFPQAAIDVIAPSWSVALTERMPEVRRGLNSPFGHGALALRERHALAKSLQGHYTRAYNCQNSFKSALLPYWAKIPTRIGWLGEMRYGLLNVSRRLDKALYPKMQQRFVALADLSAPAPSLEACPAPVLTVTPKQQAAVIARFKLDLEKPVLILCPGAAFGTSKQWTATGYAQVAEQYFQKGWQIWILGSAKEKRVAETISRLVRGCIVDFTGRSSLIESIDLLSMAQLVITNDSGLMHMAAALERPLVAVYGSSDPEFTPPISKQAEIVRHKLPCSPCFKRECPLKHHHCMTKLSSDKVLAATYKVLEHSTCES